MYILLKKKKYFKFELVVYTYEINLIFANTIN